MRASLYAVACIVAMGTVAMPVLAMPAVAQQGATDGQWREFGAGVGATKYSSLAQIGTCQRQWDTLRD